MAQKQTELKDLAIGDWFWFPYQVWKLYFPIVCKGRVECFSTNRALCTVSYVDIEHMDITEICEEYNDDMVVFKRYDDAVEEAVVQMKSSLQKQLEVMLGKKQT